MICYLGLICSLCFTVIETLDNFDINGDNFSKKVVDFGNGLDTDSPIADNTDTKAPNVVNKPDIDEAIALHENITGDCKSEFGPKSRLLKPNSRSLGSSEIHDAPQVRMIHSKKITGNLQVHRRKLGTKHCGTEVKDLAPKTSEKIETYTETYTVTQIKHRTLTRRHKYIQRRRQVKQRINKPVLIVKRRIIKEKQTFERIIPKVVETKEIVNHPEVKTKIVTGPVEEVTEALPTNSGIDVYETTSECVEDSAIIHELKTDRDIANQASDQVVVRELLQQVIVPELDQQVISFGKKSNVDQQKEAAANRAAEEPVKVRKLARALNLDDDDALVPPHFQSHVSFGSDPNQHYVQEVYAPAFGYPHAYYGYPYAAVANNPGANHLFGSYGKKK